MHRRSKVSAPEVTGIIFFECLYLFLDCANFHLESTVRVIHNSDRLLINYFSMAPQHDSPSNLAVPVPSKISGKIANLVRTISQLNSKIDSHMRKTLVQYSIFFPLFVSKKERKILGPFGGNITYIKFARKNNFLALGVCFPQARRIVSFPQKKIDEIRCKLYSTENPRSFEKYPTPP